MCFPKKKKTAFRFRFHTPLSREHVKYPKYDDPPSLHSELRGRHYAWNNQARASGRDVGGNKRTTPSTWLTKISCSAAWLHMMYPAGQVRRMRVLLLSVV